MRLHWDVGADTRSPLWHEGKAFFMNRRTEPGTFIYLPVSRIFITVEEALKLALSAFKPERQGWDLGSMIAYVTSVNPLLFLGLIYKTEIFEMIFTVLLKLNEILSKNMQSLIQKNHSLKRRELHYQHVCHYLLSLCGATFFTRTLIVLSRTCVKKKNL